MAGYLIEINGTSAGATLQARIGTPDGSYATADEACAATQSTVTQLWTAKGKDPQDVTASVIEIR